MDNSSMPESSGFDNARSDRTICNISNSRHIEKAFKFTGILYHRLLKKTIFTLLTIATFKRY